MALSPEEFEKRLDQFKDQLLEKFPEAIHASGLSAFQIVKRRILKFGTGADGQKLGKYSENQVPLFFTKNGKVMAPFSSGAIVQAAEDKLAKLKKPSKKERSIANALSRESGISATPTLSYKQWREFNNLQTSFVDLSFSGLTWTDFGVTGFDSNGVRPNVIVGPLNRVNRKGGASTETITDSLYDKYGDYLELSEEEEEVINESIDEDITNLFKQIIFEE